MALRKIPHIFKANKDRCNARHIFKDRVLKLVNHNPGISAGDILKTLKAEGYAIKMKELNMYTKTLRLERLIIREFNEKQISTYYPFVMKGAFEIPPRPDKMVKP